MIIELNHGVVGFDYDEIKEIFILYFNNVNIIFYSFYFISTSVQQLTKLIMCVFVYE